MRGEYSFKEKFIVTKISNPSDREIELRCPGCNCLIWRWVPKDSIEGQVQCHICHTELKWEKVVEKHF